MNSPNPSIGKRLLNWSFVQFIKKNLIDYFRDEGFNWQTHLIVGIFLAITLPLNYHFDFYDWMVRDHYQEFSSVALLFVFYSIAFLFTTAVVSFFTKTEAKKPIKNKKFILYGLVGIFFMSLDCSYYVMKFAAFLEGLYPLIYPWLHLCISNLSSLITVIIPLYIMYFLVKDFKPELYGLKLNGAKVIPYFWLTLFMVPLIYLASLQPDFLDAYPSYENYWAHKHLGVEEWVTAGTFELCYGFDFLSVELFYRGFMVIALSRFVGKDAILPMVTVYCLLHFGKPMGEAISSIFGGYILGILAYRSRNIFGGLIAHLGVAWGMELMAWWQG